MLFYLNNSICIQDLTKIISIESKVIIVRDKKIEYTIKGSNLFVFYLSDYEVKLNGEIKEVLFNE